MNHVVNACKVAGVSVGRHDNTVKQMQNNARMRADRLPVIGRREVLVMTWLIFRRSIMAFHLLGQRRKSAIYLVWLWFLLRVQSEGLVLQAGKSTAFRELPKGRMSSLWGQCDTFFLRFARRKHRVHGALLRRRCNCRAVGVTFCVVHRFAELCLEAGEWLTEMAPHQALQELRRLLQRLGVEHADLYTLKAFRASRATCMAAAGDSLAEIMLQGEWRSSALLSYVNESAVDSQRFVQALMQEDEGDNKEELTVAPGTRPGSPVNQAASSVVALPAVPDDDSYAP